MSLRTNIVLKLFAILLFSFEVIAPALIQSTEAKSQETQVCCSGHFTNVITSLLCEENEEEEIDFEFIATSSTPHSKEFKQISWIEPHEITYSRPPLFTLFHTYII
jgi:hypothetical protein